MAARLAPALPRPMAAPQGMAPPGATGGPPPPYPGGAPSGFPPQYGGAPGGPPPGYRPGPPLGVMKMQQQAHQTGLTPALLAVRWREWWRRYAVQAL